MFSVTSRKAELQNAVRQLNGVSNETGLVYLSSGEARSAFFREINALINHVTREVDIHCMSLSGAIKTLNEETAYLRQQQFQLMTGRMVSYAAVEKQRLDRQVKLTLKQVGFVGGGAQVFGGFGICAASLGSLCAGYGLPLAVHGINNVYENGYYLLYRKDKFGYTRQAYRAIAHRLGYSENQADMAFNVVDIALSGYGLTRPVLRADTFRLFRHINTDYIRGWQEMGPVPLIVEMSADISTSTDIWFSGRK
ncbi:DUF4225 domain-containing protein [Erwinia psidii]|uniref:DUF4225 domain-containing protein n=1 Tax=Erwinia psidii TaxID=69224 RepID=UPI00226B91DB|nr:DUF4225 domain-containing protein [Erwinia psidii]MCX8959395.1 DUF4225 domain-containing protein [Erwinia psidii]